MDKLETTPVGGPGAKRRIIETEMPLTAISIQSAREKSIRHGHLSTLHIWWARRPLAACRAAIFAALIPEPDDPREAAKLQKFIAALADWDNSIDSDNPGDAKGVHHYIRDAQAYVRSAFPDRIPRVLDSFAGGGAIPLEALRLGCETHALDLNPVAHLLELATLVYPQQYAHRPGPYRDKPGATLAGDVKRWGQWVLEQAYAEIGDLYPKGANGSTTVAYLWARTIPCPNATCGVPVPLIRQTWLARKRGNQHRFIAYKVEATGPAGVIRYRIADPVTKEEDLGFDPTLGTTRGGIATCPCCGTPLSETYIVGQSQAGHMGSTPVAVVTDGTKGKGYREIRETDETSFSVAEQRLRAMKDDYDPLTGELSPIPDELLPPQGTLGFRIQRYGFREWGDLFNSRQALCLATFSRVVSKASEAIHKEVSDPEYAKAITTYLAINVDRLADYNSSFCQWQVSGEQIGHTFGRQAIPMTWDYCEVNPFSGLTGDWDGGIDWIRRVIEHAAASGKPASVRRGSASDLPYPTGFFDAVITDPPYYDNVPYSDLSDFFYVWLRRTISNLYPTVLGTPLTPKPQEIIQDPVKGKSKADFERMLSSAFEEIKRVLRDDGICVVVYAHKAISAWETLVGSLLKAGLTVDGSWPFSTEMANRLRGMGSAALASSIFLVCRKRKVDAGVGIASEVRQAIEGNVRASLDQFWKAGLRGADFFISAIGPATAAFSRYETVMTLGGTEVTAGALLEWVQQTVADYALRRIFSGAAEDKDANEFEAGLGAVDDETRFYVLWRWTYDGRASIVGTMNGVGNEPATQEASPIEDQTISEEEDAGISGKSGVKKIPFGDAHLMATALGADVTSLVNRFHILEGTNTVRLLGAEERQDRMADFGEPRVDGSRPPLIDILHRAELLWAAGRQADLAEYLDDVLHGEREVLRRVAQALVDLLPRGELEKQRLEGFLYSGVAQDRAGGEHASQAPAVVQTGFGEEFGRPDVVIRTKHKGRR